MKTPEEIAEGHREGRGDPEERYSIALEAAREAQREPQFAPEGVPDEYRDAERTLVTATGFLALEIHGSYKTRTPSLRVTAAQATHILVYLSEQSRAGDRS